MNQILEPEHQKYFQNQKQSNKKNNNILKKNIYKIQFIFFSIITLILFSILILRIYKQNEKEKLSQKLISRYSVSTLYANETSSYSANHITSNDNNNNPFVIGIIKINKINLNYPILSYTTNDLLEISLCRFAGPMPNEIGNLCIAGHNYVDYKFFSRLYELKLNDLIEIYDLSGNMIKYSIYDIYETPPNDISCINQDTNNNKIITLLTCNNVNGKRLVIVAKENKNK